jgi:propanol-preferring alcohol dehydrogenase
MRALRMTTDGITLVEVADPVPGRGQVLLRVLASGICQSDLHVLDRTAGSGWDLPFTIGHETAGEVVGAGAGVDAGMIGHRYVVYAPLGCGGCAACAQGSSNYCRRRRSDQPVGLGLGADGGMADLMLVDADRLVAADGLDPAVAAVMADAGLTSLHALRCLSRPIEGLTSVMVIGVGGVGHVALGLLRTLSAASVTAVDTRASARGLATELGAAAVAPADARRLVDDTSRGEGVDAVLDFVGSDESLELAGSLLGQDGDLVMVGAGGGSTSFAKGTGALPLGVHLHQPFWGRRPDLVDVVGIASGTQLGVRTTHVGLDAATAGLDDLRLGNVLGRLVVVPSAGTSDALLT